MTKHSLRVDNQFSINCDDYILIYKNDNSDKTFLGSTAKMEDMIKMIVPLFEIVKGYFDEKNKK